MKFLFTIIKLQFIVTLACCVTFGQVQTEEYISDENTVLLLHLNETSGNIAYDESSYSNNGTIHTNQISEGKFFSGRSFPFNNIDQGITLPYTSSLNIIGGEPITMEAWIKTDIYEPGATQIIRLDEYQLYLGSFGGKGHLQFFRRDGNNWNICQTNNLIPLNEWVHLLATYNGSDTKMYINGIEQEYTVFINTYNQVNFIRIASFNGISIQPTAAVLIDEVRISNVARDEELVAYYPFNGNANDESGNGNDGTVNGAQLTSDMCGNENSAYNFLADVNSKIIIADNTILDFSNSFTVACWARFNEPWIFHSESIIFNYPFPTAEGFSLGVNQDNSLYGNDMYGVQGRIFTTGSGLTDVIKIVPFSFLDNWHHYAIVFNNGQFYLYIDGVQEDLQLTTGNLVNTTHDLIIGGNANPVSGAFNRDIDEIRIYNYSLTEEEILGLIEECPYGHISGTVSFNSTGLEDVIVKLLDTNEENPIPNFDDQYTDANGEYSFVDVPTGDYKVMIVEPLGYISDGSTKTTTVVANETSVVDFNLTEVVVMNNARSKGYWKHQFDVYVRNKGNAQESEQDLNDYIDLVHQHYTLYYDIFTNVNTFEEWQAILSLRGKHPMADRAKQHLSALILNMVSNKIGQYTVVTDDGRDVGDVVQYVSELIIDGDDTNDELAKDLAESVNNQQMIASGIVDEGDILFKVSSETGEVLTYDLENNYPNPFNPSTRIKYQIPDAGFVTLKVYDVLGNEVATLVTENKETGRYNITFDAAALSSGVYIYQLSVNDYLSTKKMVLLR